MTSEATKFIAACYGYPHEENMTSLRYLVWTTKMSNLKLNLVLELKVLPPTTETLRRTYIELTYRKAI